MGVSLHVLEELKPLPYQAVRKLVRDGDILLCQGRDPFSKLIRWSTESPWSHIAVAFRIDGLDKVVAVEAVEKIGVRCVALSEFCSRDSEGTSPYPGKILLARHPAFADETRTKEMAKCAFDHLGARFAPGEIAKIGLRIAQARLFGAHKMPKMLIPNDEFICSEFVAKAFDAANVRVPWDGLGFIAPADFANAPEVEAIAQVDVSKPPRPPKARNKS